MAHVMTAKITLPAECPCRHKPELACGHIREDHVPVEFYKELVFGAAVGVMACIAGCPKVFSIGVPLDMD